jgi:hypothetical protein
MTIKSKKDPLAVARDLATQVCSSNLRVLSLSLFILSTTKYKLNRISLSKSHKTTKLAIPTSENIAKNAKRNAAKLLATHTYLIPSTPQGSTLS